MKQSIQLFLSIVILSAVVSTTPSHSEPEVKDQLLIAGSTAVAEFVHQTEDAFFKHSQIKLNVRSIGTAKGIVAVAEGIVDIGLASRYLTVEEQAKWPDIEQTVVAMDALAVIVNKQNPIENLTLAQLSALYCGDVKVWGDLSGELSASSIAKERITLLSKAPGHGTFAVFSDYLQVEHLFEPIKQRVFFKARSHNATYSQPGAFVYDQYTQALGYVQRTPSAIAYDSYGAIYQLTNDKRTDQVTILRINGIAPTLSTIQDKSYPLLRPLVLLVNSKQKSAAVDLYVQFLLSPDGKAAIEKGMYLMMD